VKDKIRKHLPRIYAFASTLTLSLAIVNALPKAREQRRLMTQRFFAEAATDGDVRRMRSLHAAGASVNARGNCCLPLFLAAGEGKLEAVRYLLDEGADVNAREKPGDTALTEATFYGRLDVVKELLFRGADINAIGNEGTALDIAVKKRYAGIAELLKHRGGKPACELRKCN
jgi:ankyrin repeat protein